MNLQPILNIYKKNSFLNIFKIEEIENEKFLNSLFNIEKPSLISIHYKEHVFEELQDYVLFKKQERLKEQQANENGELSVLDFSRDKPNFIFSFNNRIYTVNNFNQIELDYESFKGVYSKMIGYNNFKI